MRRFVFAVILGFAFVGTGLGQSIPIKQGSTAVKVQFLMTLSSDHSTGATGLAPAILIGKNGAALAAATGTVAEVGSGLYAYAPSAADTGTLGSLVIHVTAATADTLDFGVMVVAYDPLNANTMGLVSLPSAGTLAVNPTINAVQSFNNTGQVATIPANATQFAGQAITATAPVTVPSLIGTSTYAGGPVASVTAPVTTNFAPTDIATAIWQDLLTGTDFATTGSAGALMKTLLPPPATVTVGSYANGVTAPLPVGSGTGQILLTNGQVTPVSSSGTGSGVQVTSGTITAATSASSFTATLSASASGNTAAYVGKIVFFQGGSNTQQRGQIKSVIISGSPGSYSVTFTMDQTLLPAIQTTPTVGDTLTVF